MSELQPPTTQIWRGDVDAGSDTSFDPTNLSFATPGLTLAHLDLDLWILPEESSSLGEFFVPPSLAEHPSSRSRSVYDEASWTYACVPPLSMYSNNLNNPNEFLPIGELDRLKLPSDLPMDPFVNSIPIAEPPEAAPAPLLLEKESGHLDTLPSTKPVKIPRKRGRKRKELDDDAKMVEHEKFLERNRVAANRCREKKKAYVANLEIRCQEVRTDNSSLKAELEWLGQELATLRLLAKADCGCDKTVLAANLRKKLGAEEGLGSAGVEEMISKFLMLKFQGGALSTDEWNRMGSMQSLGSLVRAGSSCWSEGVMDDDIFSALGEKEVEEDSDDTSEHDLPSEDRDLKKGDCPVL